MRVVTSLIISDVVPNVTTRNFRPLCCVMHKFNVTKVFNDSHLMILSINHYLSRCDTSTDDRNDFFVCIAATKQDGGLLCTVAY